jgi:hypothetical protein
LGLKKYIYSKYSLLSSTHLWFLCSNFFNPSNKNSFSCAANKEIGKDKDLSAPLHSFLLEDPDSWKRWCNKPMY